MQRPLYLFQGMSPSLTEPTMSCLCIASFRPVGQRREGDMVVEGKYTDLKIF